MLVQLAARARHHATTCLFRRRPTITTSVVTFSTNVLPLRASNTKSSLLWQHQRLTSFSFSTTTTTPTTTPTATDEQPLQMKRPTAPGLFGLENLVRPEDFAVLTENAVNTINQLVLDIVKRDSERRSNIHFQWTLEEAQCLLDDLDRISYTLCDVVDTAELVRQSHASDTFREAADGIYHGLSDVLAQLSSSKGLYWSIRLLTDDTEFFERETTSEHQRMAIMLQREFERDGIHMSDDDQKSVMEYRNQITRLETSFTQIASGQSGPPPRRSSDGREAPDHVVVSRRKLAFMPHHLLQSFPPSSSLLGDEVIVPVAR
jgi:intermediate peptidase